MIRESLLFIFILLSSFRINAQFEESEKEKFKQLNKYLCEQGVLKECNISDDHLFDFISIRNLISSNYPINFKINKFSLKGCMDCQTFIYIESEYGLEIFDLCNTGPVYSSLFCHLQHSPGLTKDQLLFLLKEVSFELENLSPSIGVNNDWKIKRTQTCF